MEFFADLKLLSPYSFGDTEDDGEECKIGSDWICSFIAVLMSICPLDVINYTTPLRLSGEF